MSQRHVAWPEPRLTTAYAHRNDGKIYVNSRYLPEQDGGESACSWYALNQREATRLIADPAEQQRIGLYLVGSDHRLYVSIEKIANPRRRRVFHGAPASDELTALLIEEIHRVASKVVSQSLRELQASQRDLVQP